MLASGKDTAATVEVQSIITVETHRRGIKGKNIRTWSQHTRAKNKRRRIPVGPNHSGMTYRYTVDEGQGCCMRGRGLAATPTGWCQMRTRRQQIGAHRIGWNTGPGGPDVRGEWARRNATKFRPESCRGEGAASTVLDLAVLEKISGDSVAFQAQGASPHVP
jgi:hypothetical protein